jgi:hypothetical protein
MAQRLLDETAIPSLPDTTPGPSVTEPAATT